ELAGTQGEPKATQAATIAIASGQTESGRVTSTAIAAAAARPARATGTGPIRSESRPKTGLIVASIPAATRNVAPIAAAPAPSALIRSGARTSRTPKTSAGRAVNHSPAHIRGSRRAASRRSATEFARPRGEAGIVSAQTPSAAIAAPIREKTRAGLVTVATAPRTGPRSAPAIPTPRTAPTTVPRCAGAALATSQARPPAHRHEP